MIGCLTDVPLFILSGVKGEFVLAVVVMEMAGCTVFAVFGGEKLVLLDSRFLQEKCELLIPGTKFHFYT
jgi:hypothetical protein